MCTDVEENVGEATELAIINAAREQGKYKERLYQKFTRINDIPFDSDRKMMSTIHRIGSERIDLSTHSDEWNNESNLIGNTHDNMYSNSNLNNETTKNSNSSDLKILDLIHNSNDKFLCITKGAPEVILKTALNTI